MDSLLLPGCRRLALTHPEAASQVATAAVGIEAAATRRSGCTSRPETPQVIEADLSMACLAFT